MSHYCADALRVPVKRFQQIYKGFLSDFQKGLFSEDTLWEKLCAQLKCKKPTVSSLWEEAFRSVYDENIPVFQLAEQLHQKGYRVGLLSNTEAPAIRFIHAKKYTMFDITIFSCEEQTCKSEERIFRILLNRLLLKPDEVVFIDDNKKNIDIAQKMGIISILFKNPHQLIDDLDPLLSS